MLRSFVRSILLVGHVLFTGVLFFAAFLYVFAHTELEELYPGSPVEAGTIPVVASETRNFDGERFVASRALELRTFPSKPIIIGFSEFIRDRLTKDGVTIVSNREFSDQVVIIEKKIMQSDLGNPRPNFRVNRLIDFMYCRDPIEDRAVTGGKCDHIKFEFYFNGDCDLTPLFEEFWRTIRETRPVILTTTWAFRPNRTMTLQCKARE